MQMDIAEETMAGAGRSYPKGILAQKVAQSLKAAMLESPFCLMRLYFSILEQEVVPRCWDSSRHEVK